jgi:hypothetical protein
MKFFAGMMLLRFGAGTALLWLRVHPADWSPVAAYGLRGLCWACLAASLTRYALGLWRHLRPAGWSNARNR